MKELMLLFVLVHTAIVGTLLFYMAKQMAAISWVLQGILRAIQ